MKMYKNLFMSCLIAFAFMAFVSNARAATLSQTSVSVSAGQSTTVYAYNVLSSLYLASNSNPSIASVSMSGNTVTIYGVTTGNTNATICDTNSCNTLYISVTGYNNYYNGYNNGTGLGLNISNITIPTGSSVTLSSSNSYNYSGTGLYVSSNLNPNVASTVLGSSSISLGCTLGALYSTLTGQPCSSQYYGGYNNGYNNGYNIPGCYAGSAYSTTTGQLCSSYNNNYNNSINNGNGSITISAISPGSDTLTLCQNGGVSSCSTMYITVTGYAIPMNSSYYSNPLSTSGIPTVYSNSTAN